jgi:hypothetical protein
MQHELVLALNFPTSLFSPTQLLHHCHCFKHTINTINCESALYNTRKLTDLPDLDAFSNDCSTFASWVGLCGDRVCTTTGNSGVLMTFSCCKLLLTPPSCVSKTLESKSRSVSCSLCSAAAGLLKSPLCHFILYFLATKLCCTGKERTLV